MFDVVRGLGWPEANPGRALRNRFLDRWNGRERQLAAALDTAVVWAGEAVDLIKDVERAATLVARISAETSVQLARAADLVRTSAGTQPLPAQSNVTQTA